MHVILLVLPASIQGMGLLKRLAMSRGILGLKSKGSDMASEERRC